MVRNTKIVTSFRFLITYELLIFSKIEMNLNKILKSLENLNNEHALINSKFSSSHRKGYVYKKCLKEDELEDMRIYGTCFIMKATLMQTQFPNLN